MSNWFGVAAIGAVIGGTIAFISAAPVVIVSAAAFYGALAVGAVISASAAANEERSEEIRIPETIWKERWDALWRDLETTVPKTVNASQSTGTGTKRFSAASEDKIKQEVHSITAYKEAIENGYAEIGFGRVIIIGTQDDQKETLLRAVTRVPDIGLKEHLNIILHGDTFQKMNKAEEAKELARLAKKVIKEDSKLGKIIQEIQVVKKTFNPSCSNDVPVPEKTVATTISDVIRSMICNIKTAGDNAAGLSLDLSSLLHVSDCTAHGFLENVIPAFITSRSIFFLLVNIERTPGSDKEPVEKEVVDQVRQWITYIDTGLTKKAEKYHTGMNQQSVVTSHPYPKAEVVQVCKTNEPSIKMEIENGLPLTAKNLFHFQLVEGDLKKNPRIKELEDKTKTFVKDLKIKTPLLWEFFRKILNELKYKHPFISMGKISAIAMLCGIKLEDLPSVLNFYHEHGAILFYPEVEKMCDIVILDPKWLMLQFQHLYSIKEHQSQISSPFKTKGILVADLWNSKDLKVFDDQELKEFEYLPMALIMLMETFHLAAFIQNVPNTISDSRGKHFFIPSVRERRPNTNPAIISGVFNAARLCFVFSTNYVPPGCFVRLVAKLLEGGLFQVNFNAEIYSDQISFIYGKEDALFDQLTIFTTPTSICVDLIRERFCGGNYRDENFPGTCHTILGLLNCTFHEVLEQWFGDIKVDAAFQCECDKTQQHHYVIFKTWTKYSVQGLRCQKKNIYDLRKDQKVWLDISHHSNNGEISENEMRQIIQAVKHKDFVRIVQALEISHNVEHDIPKSDKYALLKLWSDDMKCSAHAFLLFHLRQLGLDEVANNFDTGEYRKPIPPIYQVAPDMKDLMNTIAAVIPIKWRFVGIQLGLDGGILDEIAQLQQPQHCFEKVLREWKKKKPRPYTWRTIIEAIETPSVGEMALAECIREQLNM